MKILKKGLHGALNSRGIISTIFIKDHYMMPQTKYQGYWLHDFGKKKKSGYRPK
jgi:hypothetical protein